MDSERIENLAIIALENILYKSDLIQADIRRNDKIPCWDGTVYLYSKPGKHKDDILGKCDIQIKGKVTKNTKVLKRDHLKYSVELTDLRNYWNTGGVLYFVALIDEKCTDINEIKIYYYVLLPGVIRKIFHEIDDENQKEKTLRFSCFPTEVDLIEKQVREFIIHSRLQHGTTPKEPFNADDFQNLIRDGGKVAFFSDVDDLFREQYIYEFLGKNVYRYIDQFALSSLRGKELPIIVKLDNDVFYETVDFEQTKETITFFLDRCITIHLSKDSKIANIKLEFKGLLDNVIKAADFFYNFMQGKKLIMEPYIEIEGLHKDLDLKEIERSLSFLERTKRLLEILHVRQPFYLDNLTNDNKKLLSDLADCIIDHKKLPVKQNIDNVIKVFGIGSLQIAIIARIENQFVTYFDYFNENMLRMEVVLPDGKVCPTSVYTELKKKNFLELSNIDYDAIVSSIKKYKNEEHAVRVNELLLNLLDAYDDCHDIIMLNAAIEIAKWLKENGKLLLYDINYYQAVKRKRNFTDDEITEILKLKETPEKKIVAAASILLGSPLEYKHYLNEMTDDEKREIMDYPISHLL